MPISLTAEKLSRLRKHDFERLCRALLDAEYRVRFGQGHVDIDGPSTEDDGDGGYDLLATISHPAKESAFHPVLGSNPGSRMYSCKSHKDTPEGSPANRGWIKQVRTNIDPDPAVWDARGSMARDADQEKVREATPSGLREILERLAAGDEFYVLVNVEAGNRQKYAREFADRFRTRAALLEISGKIQDAQVRVLGAQELVNAFNERPVALDPDLVAKLGGSDATFLMAWDRWTEDISAQRRRMKFVSDAHRNALHNLLKAAVDGPGHSTVWVIGDPGVGKTRAVHEFFETSPALQRRVYASENWPALLKWCDQSDPIESDLVVVADEVPGDRAHELYRKFILRTRGTSATLIMIGTKSGETSGTPQPFELDRVEAPAFRKLIEAEFDATSADRSDRARTVALVEDLAQRYPLFAMWLTRGLAENPDLLDQPGTDLTDAQDPWTATKLVLANRKADPERWSEVAETRGRALLLALMVPEESPSLPYEEEQALSDGLGRGWTQLESAQLECRERGILRATRFGHVYVSPANLERLILNHFFGRTPPPINPVRLRKRIGSRMDRLLERAEIVKASESCRRALALACVEAKLAEIERGDAPGDALFRIAAEVPTVVVRGVHALARRVSSGELEGSAAALGQVLGHLRHRSLGRAEFELVEDGLFALAYHGGKEVRPSAAHDWISLFSSGLHATHQPFDFRVSLLRRRLESSDRSERLAAVNGAAAACNPSFRGIALNTGLDDRDEPSEGEWLGPTSEREVVRRASIGWEQLLRSAADEDSEVADRARRLIAAHLRTGFKVVFTTRPDLLAELAQQAAIWTSSQRNALGGSLEDVNRYDREHLSASADTTRALEALAIAVAPNSTTDRVMAQVGRWNPIPGPFDGTDRLAQEHRADVEVARALVDEPSALWSLRDWLSSVEAVRVSAFGFALGEVDEDRVLLDKLLDSVRASSLATLCASYLAAWAHEDAPAFDSWLGTALDDPRLDDVLAQSLCASTATDGRVRALTTLVQRGNLQEHSLRGIGYRDWASSIDCGNLDELIGALVDDGRREMLSQAIGLTRQRLDRGPLDEHLEQRLVPLIDATRSGHLASTGERDWARLSATLLRAGRTEILASIVRALDDDGYSHQAERAVLELAGRDDERDALWDALLAGIADDPVRVISLDRLLSSAKLEMPVDKVLAWADSDPDRGMLAARLARPYRSDLDPLARALIQRFGPSSRPAKVLRARTMSTPTAVQSVAAFFEEQARHAEAWATEDEGAVAEWARALATDLRDRAAAEREDETLWRRHG